jgi:Holliday junction resolvase
MAQEKTFENKIKRMLKDNGAYFVKFFANSFTKTGVPDILACINGYFVGIEVKAENGHPSELQLYNIEQIRNAGGFAFVVYPSGYTDLCKIIEGLRREEFTHYLPIILK